MTSIADVASEFEARKQLRTCIQLLSALEAAKLSPANPGRSTGDDRVVAELDDLARGLADRMRRFDARLARVEETLRSGPGRLPGAAKALPVVKLMPRPALPVVKLTPRPAMPVVKAIPRRALPVVRLSGR